MRGARKGNGKYIFIPPQSLAEAEKRRSDTIRELGGLKRQLKDLQSVRDDLGEEVERLNAWLRASARA